MCNLSEFIVKATVASKKGRCDPESVFFSSKIMKSSKEHVSHLHLLK